MIYANRCLKSYLTHLTLVGQDEDGRLEWLGSDSAWYDAEENSMTPLEFREMQDTEESDRYDLATCHK
jgi:hypothetical protein